MGTKFRMLEVEQYASFHYTLEAQLFAGEPLGPEGGLLSRLQDALSSPDFGCVDLRLNEVGGPAPATRVFAFKFEGEEASEFARDPLRHVRAMLAEEGIHPKQISLTVRTEARSGEAPTARGGDLSHGGRFQVEAADSPNPVQHFRGKCWVRGKNNDWVEVGCWHPGWWPFGD